MRAAWIALIVLLVAAPVYAQSAAPRGNCNKLSKQIARYQRDLVWAEERGNERWAESNRKQIARLHIRRVRRCPQFAGSDDNMAERLAGLLGTAAKAAARYFTLGQ